MGTQAATLAVVHDHQIKRIYQAADAICVITDLIKTNLTDADTKDNVEAFTPDKIDSLMSALNLAGHELASIAESARLVEWDPAYLAGKHCR